MAAIGTQQLSLRRIAKELDVSIAPIGITSSRGTLSWWRRCAGRWPERSAASRRQRMPTVERRSH